MGTNIMAVKPAFTMSICDTYNYLVSRIFFLQAKAKLTKATDSEYKAPTIKSDALSLVYNLHHLDELLTPDSQRGDIVGINDIVDRLDQIHKASGALRESLKNNIAARAQHKNQTQRYNNEDNPDSLTPLTQLTGKVRHPKLQSSTYPFTNSTRQSIPPHILYQNMLAYQAAKLTTGEETKPYDLEQSLLNFADTIFQWADAQTEIIYDSPDTPLDTSGVQSLMNHIKSHQPQLALPSEACTIYINSNPNLEFVKLKRLQLTPAK